jgi:AraC-like DNA-binding protein
MRANEFITERKKKRKSNRAYGGYFYPGYGYGDNSSGEAGGDGGGGESMYESAIDDLVKELPSLAKHKYDTMDKLLKKIASKHKISDKALERLFTKKFNKSPSNWLKNKLDETSDDTDLASEVQKFVDWAANRLNLKKVPSIELSMDSEEAQTNHHTGGHVPGEDSVWVYAKNRNLVDILRTVFHELVHVRQHEIGMIKPGDSYPGSPIEAMADMLAGKYIKIYGEKNNHIFQ